MSAPPTAVTQQRKVLPRGRWRALLERCRARLPSFGRGVTVPTILQTDAVECGAACLAMVLAYHGRFVPLEELRAACGVSRDGSKASKILQAARSYGLVAQAYRKEPGQLREVRLPAVLHWNLNHFVVLEGFAGGRVRLRDPSRGGVAVSEGQLDRSFSGVVLTFEAGPEFRPGGVAPDLVSALGRRLTGSRAGLLYVLLAGLALLIPGMVLPSFSRVFVDNVLVKGMPSWTLPLLLLMGATLLIQAALVWLKKDHLLRLETRLALESSAHFVWHVLRLPYGFFAQRYAGDVASRVSASDRIARLLSTEVATVGLDLLLVVFYAILMIQYDVVLTLVGVGTAVLNLLLLKYSARKQADASQQVMQERGKLTGIAMAGLQSIEMLKATGSESDFFVRWSGQHARLMNAYQKLGLLLVLFIPLPTLVISLNTALILGIGGFRIMDGELSMGMLLAFQMLLMSFLRPINRMMGIGTQFHEVRAGMARLDDILQASPDPNAPPPQGQSKLPEITAAKLSGRIELRGITFGYSSLDPPIITDLDLTLEPGSRVALVGKSGSGKSTVAKLVSGLCEPWSGEVLFDGRPRSEIPREVISGSLALVEQEVFLFEGTIRDNLTMWNESTPEGHLLDAVHDACIDTEVASRPGGFMSEVEEGGRNFSGGQRQRMEIARALAGKPTILVLDEATSALDPVTETRIDDRLRQRGCTCLIVAHRLSAIRDCDEIIVLENGRIVQRGIHDSMKDAPGPYRELIESE